MSLPTHPVLSLVDEHATGLKSMLTHYIDATVDSQFASLRNSIETMIQSGVIGPNCDGTHFGMTLPPQTHTNTHQSCDECSHKYSNEQLTKAQNFLQNEVSLSNTINAVSMIKQEFDDDEDGEEIDDDNVDKCEQGICTSGNDAEMGENGNESCDKTQQNINALENNQTNQLIITNDILPSPLLSPTNQTNIELQIKQECLNDSSNTSIPLDFTNNAAPNYISTDEQTEGQNTQIETDEFDYNDDVDDDCNEDEYSNQPDFGNCYLDDENNEVSAGGSNDVEHSNLQSISSSTANQMTNIETDQIARAVIIEPNNQQSTQSTSGVRFSTRKRISKKVFGHDQSNDDAKRHKSANGKRVQSNESVKKAKHKQSADESTTNPIQPNLVQPNRRLQCSHCTKSFVYNSKLQQHLRRHTGERPFQCDLCDKRFSLYGNLTKHQLIHQNIKLFQCNHCAKKFTQKCNLEVHEQAIHLHVICKPYRCKQCAHSATTRSNVISHIREVHFGLPATVKEQLERNIIDDRDPRELLEKV